MIEWRVIPGLEDYEVSGNGDVRRITPIQGGTVGKVLKPKANNQGYLCLILRMDREKKYALVHRLVAIAFISEQPGIGYEVAHNNGDCLRNHFLNLRWATGKENQADRIAHGTSNQGQRHGMSKLTDVQVVEIKARLVRERITQTALGAEYGISRTQISAIARGKEWKHLQEAA